MKFSLSWLKSHLDTNASLSEIETRLTMLGLEVEGVEDPAAKLSGFIVGHVLEAAQHPNADRLRLCKVDTGKTQLQIVCGAPNARAGLKVILALPGTVIPATGEPLKVGAIRGIESQGMMCSWRELGLGEDHDGIAELALDVPTGAPVAPLLDLEPVIEIAVTPNRGDCLGVRGIARDLAAVGLGTLKPLGVTPVPGGFASPVGVTLDFPADSANACPLFAGRFIRGLKNGESPDWLKTHLTSIGLRPISALVDITNFFTIDLCRPLHVFDAAKLQGSVQARLGLPGESFAALNGRSYDLDADIVVIADDSGPLGLGGIIGGESSSVSAETNDIFLEAALFDPVRIGRAGRRLAIDSDARHRFERGIDPAFTIPGMELATRMILDLCGGEASEPVIAGAVPPATPAISFRPARVGQIGGVSPGEGESRRILVALGCEVVGDGPWSVLPPSWRSDLGAEHDLVEEVLRINGFDAIPAEPLPRPSQPAPAFSIPQRRVAWIRRALAGRGMVEAVTWSFMAGRDAPLFGGGKEELRLANPIAAELDMMRPSPLPNLVAATGRNAARGFPDLALFEVGPGFSDDTEKGQRAMAAGLRSGRAAPLHWARPDRAVDPFDVKADLIAAIAAGAADGRAPDGISAAAGQAPAWYHPGRSAALRLGNNVLGWFGELHPRVLAALDIKGPVSGFELFLDALPPVRRRVARPAFKPSAFQPIRRDFAFLVEDKVGAEAVVRAAQGAAKGDNSAVIAEVAVFDLYAGPSLPAGHRSLAIQVTLQPVAKTLVDTEIDAIAAKIVAAVAKATGGTLRG